MGIYFIFPLSLFFCLNKMIYEFFLSMIFSLLFIIFISFNVEMMTLSLEFLSWSLLILSFFIISLMILSNLSFSLNVNDGLKFIFSLFLMTLSLVFVFSSTNLFMFYVFFEFSIIPIFMMLCGWGFNFERLQAGFYMMVYTILFSLPFLIFICSIFLDHKTLSLFFYKFYYTSNYIFVMMFLSIFMFLVKLPSFFLHLWLPKAHVEAPVSGSMILAGLLLKLGSYGLLIYVELIYFNCQSMSDFFILLGLWGGLMASIICFRQSDLKKLVAFMSVSHMGMVLSGIFTFSFISYWGAFMMMLAHGLSSSGLFFSLNCFYERFFSRSIFLISGNNMILVGLMVWFFILISANISAPPSLNFFSELSLLLGLSFHLNYSLILFLIMMFLGSICSFHLFVSTFHGFNEMNYSFSSLNLKEHLILMIHILPIVMLFLFI